MLNLKDLNGEVYVAEGTSTLEENLSSDITINFELPYTEVNKDFIYNIGSHWKVSGVKGANDRTEYVIKYVNRKTLGGKPFVECTAMTLFMDKIKTTNLYNYYEGEYTLELMLNTIFNGSGFSYKVEGEFDNSLYIETFGNGESRLEVFKRVLELWQLEFLINGETIELKKKIIRKPDYFLHDNLNATNISLEEDASEFYTYVKGYGDINSGEPLSTAGVSAIYEHPLASVVGRKEAPPVIIENDDNTSPYADVIRDKILAECKRVVDNSLKITITSDFLALKEYPEAYPKLGDEITFVASNIDYDAIVRLVGISTKRNHKGDILSQNVTFGEQPLIKRRNMKAMQTTNFIYAVTNGDKLIPSNMIDGKAFEQKIDEKISNMSFDPFNATVKELIDAGIDEFEQYTLGQVIENTIETNKTNIKNAVIDGINNSTNVIKSDAIVVDYGMINKLMTNDILTNRLLANDAYLKNLMATYIVSEAIKTQSISANSGTFTSLKEDLQSGAQKVSPNAMSDYGMTVIDGGTIKTNKLTIVTSSGREVVSNGYMRGNKAVSDTLPYSYGPDVSLGTGSGSQYIVTSSSSYQHCAFFSFSHESRYLRVRVTLNTLSSAAAGRARVRSGGVYSNEVRTSSSTPGVEYGQELILDLGEPLDYGATRFAYVEFRKEGIDGKLGIRINTREQTDFI